MRDDSGGSESRIDQGAARIRLRDQAARVVPVHIVSAQTKERGLADHGFDAGKFQRWHFFERAGRIGFQARVGTVDHERLVGVAHDRAADLRIALRPKHCRDRGSHAAVRRDRDSVVRFLLALVEFPGAIGTDRQHVTDEFGFDEGAELRVEADGIKDQPAGCFFDVCSIHGLAPMS